MEWNMAQKSPTKLVKTKICRCCSNHWLLMIAPFHFSVKPELLKSWSSVNWLFHSSVCWRWPKDTWVLRTRLVRFETRSGVLNFEICGREECLYALFSVKASWVCREKLRGLMFLWAGLSWLLFHLVSWIFFDSLRENYVILSWLQEGLQHLTLKDAKENAFFYVGNVWWVIREIISLSSLKRLFPSCFAFVKQPRGKTISSLSFKSHCTFREKSFEAAEQAEKKKNRLCHSNLGRPQKKVFP